MKSQSTNWKGFIPVTLSLAPSSLSSPVMPSPVHCMVSRQTYLHLALEDEIRMFHEFAPMVANFIKSVEQSASDDIDDSGNHDDVGKVKRESIEGKTDNNVSTSTKSSYPKCWFEDEDTGTPLRWHIFAGLLYDLLKLRKIKTPNDAKMSSLPWKIRVHYTSYPDTILPLDDDIPQIIFQNYLNSLKQALYIQHNSNRVVNKMTKQNHMQLWDGIKRCKFDVYNEISSWLNRGNGSGGGEEKKVMGGLGSILLGFGTKLAELTGLVAAFRVITSPFKSIATAFNATRTVGTTAVRSARSIGTGLVRGARGLYDFLTKSRSDS